MKLLAKASLLSALLLAFTLSSCSKGDKPKDSETAPEKVQTVFKEKFPEATDVKWDKENETEWEAEFKLSGADYSSNFSSDGKWMETEHSIAVTEIPGNIKAAMDTSFVGYTIDKAEISEKGSDMLYEIKIKKGESEIEVVYDKAGTLVKQKGETEEDEEGEEEDDEKGEKEEKEEKGH